MITSAKRAAPGTPQKTNGATNRQGFASAVDHCRAWPRTKSGSQRSSAEPVVYRSRRRLPRQEVDFVGERLLPVAGCRLVFTIKPLSSADIAYGICHWAMARQRRRIAR